MFEIMAPRKGRFSLLISPLVLLGSVSLVASWLAPNHYPPWSSFHGEAAAFAALILFATAMLLRERVASIDKASILFLSLIFVVLAQFKVGQIAFLGDAAVSCLYLSGFVLAWWLGTASTTSGDDFESHLDLLAYLVVGAGLLSVYIAILQWLRMESAFGVFAANIDSVSRPYANFAQPNHLATFSLMATVLAGWLCCRKRMSKWQFLALLFYFSFGIILTQSRTGLVSAFAVGVLILIKRRKIENSASLKLVFFWWCGLGLLNGIWGPLNEALYLQPARQALASEDRPRLLMWKQLWAAVEQSPWFGYGWRQTVVAQKKGAEFFSGTVSTDYAHNFFLDILIWVGIPIGLMLCCLVLWWVLNSISLIKNHLQLFLVLTATPFAIHSLVEFPFAYSYFLFPVAWVLGSLNALQHPNWLLKFSCGGWKGGAVASSFLAFFLGFSIWAVIDYSKLEDDYQVMRFELRNLGSPPPGHVQPHLAFLSQFDEVLTVGRIRPEPHMRPQDIERLRVASDNLAWATLQLNYAVALGLNEQPLLAAAELRSLRAIYGEKSYMQAKEIIQNLWRNKYPQLREIDMP